MDLGGPKLELLGRLLSTSSLRSQVIAGNISNSNTPGFIRKEVQFEEQLLSALKRGKGNTVVPTIVDDTSNEAGTDGNNISMETEINAMRENRLTFETYAAILEGHFGMIDAAIRDGR